MSTITRAEVDALKAKLATAIRATHKSNQQAYMLRAALDRVMEWAETVMTPPERAKTWAEQVHPAIQEALKQSQRLRQ